MDATGKNVTADCRAHSKPAETDHGLDRTMREGCAGPFMNSKEQIVVSGRCAGASVRIKPENFAHICQPASSMHFSKKMQALKTTIESETPSSVLY